MLIPVGLKKRSESATTLLRRTALNSATALRDCSLYRETTLAERLACRTLMRGEALRWRNPFRPAFGL
jgi:hypothetical protein